MSQLFLQLLIVGAEGDNASAVTNAEPTPTA
jgi:hypothetical protein